MGESVFFSWQSDRPVKGGKGLLETALYGALAKLSDDATLEESARDVVLDTDTKGVAGSPPIVDVIFSKIDKAAVFVADVTFVGSRADGRTTPNPNVLIEYGWALKSVTHGRIIAVMNTAYGAPSSETLPFDMRHLRFPITYFCPDDADAATKTTARDALTRELAEAIRTIFNSDEYKTIKLGAKQRPDFELIPALEGFARFRAPGKAIGVERSSISLISQIPKEVKLRGGPAFWLRIAPTQQQGRQWELTSVEQAMNRNGKMALPMTEGYQSYGYVRGADGIGVYATPFRGEEDTRAVVFCFKSGEIWSVDTYPAQALENESGKKQFLFPEPSFIQGAQMYLPVLRHLGVSGPLQWEAGIEGIEGYTFQHATNGIPRHFGPFLSDVLSARGIWTEGQTANQALAPFFERIFSDAGSQRPAELRR